MKGLPWIFVRTYSVTVHNSTKFEQFISYQKEIKKQSDSTFKCQSYNCIVKYVIDRADIQVYNYSQKEISQHCQLMLSF